MIYTIQVIDVVNFEKHLIISRVYGVIACIVKDCVELQGFEAKNVDILAIMVML